MKIWDYKSNENDKLSDKLKKDNRLRTSCSAEHSALCSSYD